MNKKIVITIPIPSNPTEAFLSSLPQDIDIIIIDDSNGKLTFPKNPRMKFYDYTEQKKILGKYYQEYTTFHKSASCRNLAHFLAYKQGYDEVIALDYDCVLPSNYLAQHGEVFSTKNFRVASSPVWINPLENTEWFTRGYPYSMRALYKAEKIEEKKIDTVVLNMGMWENVVDINGIDKVLTRPSSSITLSANHTVVDGFIPLCGMNNAFLSKIVPAYFFLPNFPIGNWTVSRHDDIWGGYIFQKIARKKGDYISYGSPIVFHERESSQPRVLYYEHYMHILEYHFYDLIDTAMGDVKEGSYEEMFASFADSYHMALSRKKTSMPKPYYDGFSYLGKYINLWVTLFKKL